MGALGLGAIGGMLNYFGGQQQQQQQNRYQQQAAQMFQPQTQMAWAQQMNPALYNAMWGDQYYQPQGGYATAMYNIAQNPGYIDPQLMNMPLTTSARRANTDFTAAGGKLGKSRVGLRGGMGDAYALANEAARTQRDVGIQQQYGLAREQQKRADLQMLQNEWAKTLGLTQGMAGGSAGMWGQQQAPQSPFSAMGNMATQYMLGQGMQQPYQGTPGMNMQGGWGGGIPNITTQGQMFGQGGAWMQPQQQYQQPIAWRPQSTTGQ